MAQQPLINPLFPEWDWHDSNGQATAEETQRAEIALLNKGRVSRFIPIVWNDLVNKVYQLKTEIGDKWIEEYATYQNTLIPDGTYDITANAFNALVQNIKHGSEIADDEYSDLTDIDFGWATDDIFPGYIGREVVYGLSQSGAEADTVYGSYFIETVRKLNYCIALFKHYYKGYAENKFAVQNDVSATKYSGTNDDVATDLYFGESANGVIGKGENETSISSFSAIDIVSADSANGKSDNINGDFIINDLSPADSSNGKNQISDSVLVINSTSIADTGCGDNAYSSQDIIVNDNIVAQKSDGVKSDLQSQSYGQQKTSGTSGGIWHYQDGDTLYIKKSESATMVDNVLRLW